MESLHYRTSAKDTDEENDPQIRLFRVILDRIDSLEQRVQELEEEKNPTNVKLS